MATTTQLRSQYPDLVKRVTKPPVCDFSKAVGVWFLAGGAFPSNRILLKVVAPARQAFRALAAVMLAWGYEFRETAGGTLSCRPITGGTLTTLHAHGIAGDFNPSKNGYRFASGLIQWGKHTDMPKAMVDAILRIRTADGRPVFEWGGSWSNTKDPMHFEIDVFRASLGTGIDLSTVTGWKQYLAFELGVPDTGGDMIPIDNSTVRPIVFKLQDALNRAATANGFPTIAVDGIAGARTAELASIYRKGAGLEAVGSGVCFDGATIAVLLHLYGS